jgi:type I restriction enzyme S subunit
MVVKPGYKQTEVGVIPQEWEVHELGKIAHLERGKFTARPRNQPKFFGGDIPFIQTGDVTNSTGEITSYVQTLNGEGLRVSKLFPPETLFFTIAANIGDVGIAPFATAATDSLIAISPRRGAEKRWLFHALRRRKKIFEGLATHNAQLNINLEKLRPYLLDVPPEPEQRAIATALSDVDGLLGGLDRLIAKKRDLKQAVMQQLLTGQTRLPGFHGEWEDTTLGAIGECIIGLTYKPENVVEHGLLVLRSSNIQNGRLAFDDNVHVNLNVPDRLMTRTGDLLVCVRNGSRALIGKSAVINESSAGLTFGAFMSVYRTKHWRFIAHAFQSHGIQRQIRDNIGATINQITNKDMRALRVKLPREAEQTAIAEVRTEMDAELAALEQRREKTRALKQAMMQELLTGKTRLV